MAAVAWAGLPAEMQDIAVTVPAAGVLQIAIARPMVRNALRTATLGEIAVALSAADRDDGIRAAVVTGTPAVFAAGADLHELATLTAADAVADPRPRYWEAIDAFSKPLIAAVHGYALGAGCELALRADLVIASDDAQFGQPEINLGIIPGAGGMQRLIRAVGKPLAMKMVLTGCRLDARAAVAAGLVAETAAPEQCLPRAVELAATIAAKAPLAVAAAKKMLLRAYELPLAQGLREERAAFCALLDSADKREGIQAFLEKRQPRFAGR